MKGSVRKLLTIVLAAVFLCSTALFVISFFDEQENAAAYAQAKELAGHSANISAPEPATAPAPTQPVPVAEPVWVPVPVTDDPVVEMLQQIDLTALRQVNPDVVGWIHIPDTAIDYPITHGEDNSFYLSHTWEGTKNFGGSIFLETRNSPELADFNTIIYGHNMKNGSMFSALHDYSTLTYWSKHPYVYLVTDAGILRYQVFSFYNAKVDSQTYGLSFRQTETREAFIAMALENAQLTIGLTPAVTDRILTLSTCTGLGYGERRVVHAYLPMMQIEQ